MESVEMARSREVRSRVREIRSRLGSRDGGRGGPRPPWETGGHRGSSGVTVGSQGLPWKTGDRRGISGVIGEAEGCRGSLGAAEGNRGRRGISALGQSRDLEARCQSKRQPWPELRWLEVGTASPGRRRSRESGAPCPASPHLPSHVILHFKCQERTWLCALHVIHLRKAGDVGASRHLLQRTGIVESEVESREGELGAGATHTGAARSEGAREDREWDEDLELEAATGGSITWSRS